MAAKTKAQKEAEAKVKELTAALERSQNENRSLAFERDTLQKDINAKASAKKLVKINIPGILDIEQVVGPGDKINLNQHEADAGYSFVYTANE